MIKVWSEADVAYLEDKWGVVSIPSIAKSLGRTVNAIKLKAYKLGLGRHLYAGEMITVNEFCKVTGFSYNSVITTWEKYGFPAKKLKSIFKSYKMVRIEDFWKWAENHKTLIDFSRIEENILGKEPDWVKGARKISFKNRQTARKTKWSKEEEQRLIFLLDKTDYTLTEISADIGRTEGAIRRRIVDLGLKLRPVPFPKKYWSEDEIKSLVNLRAEGWNWEQIGKKLGRSAHSVEGKYERIINPDYQKEYRKRQREGSDCFQRLQCVHYTKARGCDLGGSDCDSCLHFKRILSDEERKSGWISIPK